MLTVEDTGQLVEVTLRSGVKIRGTVLPQDIFIDADEVDLLQTNGITTICVREVAAVQRTMGNPWSSRRIEEAGFR